MKLTNRFTRKLDQHSSYQRGPFYAIKVLQLVSCFVDFVIMSYFVSKLRGSHMHTPWPFIMHLIVFAISTLVSIITISVYAPATPPPKKHITLNGVLLALLAVSFGILAHSLRVTLTAGCTVESWNNSTGLTVCRLYKALFSFVVVALTTTLLGLGLDLYTLSRARASGTYIRTANPQSSGFRDEESEYRGVTQLPHITGSKPVNGDYVPSSIPSAPGFPGSEGELESNHIDPTDMDAGEMELSLVPPTTFSIASERGYRLPEEQIARHYS